MKISKFLFVILPLFVSPMAWGQYGTRSASRLTYDLSASVGSIDDKSYTEINLGLNWYMTDWVNWRNSIFSRQGSGIDSVQGLDSSLRFIGRLGEPGSTFGLDAFAGPGFRMASQKHNAVFGEGGFTFRFGGIRIGAGAKILNYFEDRQLEGVSIPKNETQYFIILGGGGTL